MKKHLASIGILLLLATGALAQTNQYTLHIVHGFNPIANQLINGDNTLSEILPNVPDGTIVYRSTDGADQFGGGCQFIDGYGWYDNDDFDGTGGDPAGFSLLPGTGYFLLNQGVPYDLIFHGTTNQPSLPLDPPCGKPHCYARQNIGVGTYENIIGQPPGDGVQMFIFKPSTATNIVPVQEPNYEVYTYAGGAWFPSPPRVPVGRPAFVKLNCLSPCAELIISNVVVTSSAITQVNYSVSVAGHCDGFDYNALTVISQPPPGSFFSPGSTTVHTIVIDNLGGYAALDTTVTVAPPVTPPITKTYSLNIKPGYNLIAYQFLNGGNTLREIMMNVPNGTIVSKYNNATSSWLQSTYDATLGAWVPPNITLHPGEGAFLYSIANNNYGLSLSGQPNLPSLPVPLTNGIVLVSRQTNGLGTFFNIFGSNAPVGARAYQWNGASYDTFTNTAAGWTPFEPTNKVGESYWISRNGSVTPPAIPIPPFISLQTGSNVTVKQGDPTNLFVLISGSSTSPLRYQWRLNSNPILNATNITFPIQNMQPTNSGTYDVLVQNSIGIVQSAPINVRLLQPPTAAFADDFAAAGSLPSTQGGFVVVSNATATFEKNEPDPGYIPGGSSVWIHWQSPLTGVASFTTAGSGFDTLLAIYSGNALTNLVSVASDDDSAGFLCSSLKFNATAGVIYSIQLDGFYGSEGNAVLTWNEVASQGKLLPTILKQPHHQTVANGGDATFTVEVPIGVNYQYQWLKDGVTINGQNGPTLTVTNVIYPATNGPVKVGAYRVLVTDPSAALSTLSQEADLQINTPTPGTPINSESHALTKLQAALDTTVRPNDPYDPPIVSGYSGSQTFSTTGSIIEPLEPLHCGVTCYFTKWHPYTATGSGLISVANSGTTFPGVLAVYTGPSFALVPLACSTGHSAGSEVVSFQTTNGVTYSIAMSATNASVSGIVSLQYANLSAPTFTSLPMSQTYTSNSVVTLSVTTAGNPGVSYQWQYNGTNIPGATSSTLPILNLDDTNQGNYSVLATNLAGSSFYSYAPVFVGNPPRFVNTTNVSGVFFTQLMGMANSNYIFQASTNNVNWVTIGSSASLSGVINLADTIQNASNVYYRAYLPAPVP